MTALLLTGASGRMAAALRPALRELYDEVRLFSRSEIDDVADGETLVRGTLEDLAALRQASAGVDAVVHLGGRADEAEFAAILSANILGTYNVFEAAHESGVGRVVYASSHHVTGFHSADEMVSVDSDVRPDTYYGVSKVFGEAIGRLYHDKWGLEVVCLRIGVCRAEPENSDQLRTWLSVPDSVRLVRAALSHDLPGGFATVYGVSDNSTRFWDASGGETIGFMPEDSADEFADRFGGHQEFSTAHQGAAFTAPDYRGGIW
ncbi:NAD-dependent epimerase/dehydratase family protein [Georgenia sp. Z1491]|uniref:NAD-dependent epimerase/dehydratase family protein n=1 Tax=Georgenia sp. Z1491 TaxID=3416707 RepID=UPI003CEB8469